MEKEEVKYFFDTYALVELIIGNPAYERFSSKTVNITIFNLAELYWVALHKLTPAQAEEVYDSYKNNVSELDDDTMTEAIHFRTTHKKRSLSYTDCIGYIYARRHGMRFLTGDKEFNDLPGVDFVKKAA